MAYDLIETSEFEGEPVEVYTFTRNNRRWQYTSADSEIVIGGSVYESVPISRTTIEQGQDPAKLSLKVTVSSLNEFAKQYVSQPPTDFINLTVQRFHSTDPVEEVITIWLGRVVNIKYEGQKCTIECEPIYTALRRPALRRLYQITCPYVLYGQQCQANPDSFSTSVTLLSVDGTTLTGANFANQPDGYFTGGFITTDVGISGTDKRFIVSHVGDTVIINIPLKSLSTGVTLEAFAGCDRTLATCDTKFSNHLNYGGQPWIPRKNPFTSLTIF